MSPSRKPSTRRPVLCGAVFLVCDARRLDIAVPPLPPQQCGGQTLSCVPGHRRALLLLLAAHMPSAFFFAYLLLFMEPVIVTISYRGAARFTLRTLFRRPLYRQRQAGTRASEPSVCSRKQRRWRASSGQPI